ncbi:hypothetical protein SEA_MOOSEHEAD_58 [Gordonia phage Moosehead]|nr:hypothetical protein SEA_MOOSEHEAD_58 [Gordonia phage Moosehead]
MSSDPAVNAAQRAKHPAWAFIDPPGAAEDIAIRAAREALAPLRPLHQPFTVRGHGGDRVECQRCLGRPWPCATARLIYPEDDL